MAEKKASIAAVRCFALVLVVGVGVFACGEAVKDNGDQKDLVDINVDQQEFETEIHIGETIEVDNELEEETPPSVLGCTQCWCDAEHSVLACAEQSCADACVTGGTTEMEAKDQAVSGCACLCRDGWQVRPSSSGSCEYTRCNVVCAEHFSSQAAASWAGKSDAYSGIFCIAPATFSPGAVHSNKAVHLSPGIIPLHEKGASP
ncbi:MAG: hypothetical protein RBU37_17990 [Myxococcota bacterium]|jgi:hypothetical protein|nr:hypothetical protein [Myxococcota bacterium]